MITPAEKRPKSNPRKDELVLQASMVLWFKNKFPDYAHRLFKVNNEGQNVSGNMATGMVPGVSDLLYADPGGLVGFEVKFKGKSHSTSHLVRQAEWMIKTLDPGRGRFVDSLEDFQTIMLGGDAGLRPERVLEYCRTCGKKNIIWGEIDG